MAVDNDGWDVDPNAPPMQWDPPTPPKGGDGWDVVDNLDSVPDGYRQMADWGFNHAVAVGRAGVGPDFDKYNKMAEEEDRRKAHFRNSPQQEADYRDDTFTGRFGRAVHGGLGAGIGSLVDDPKGYISSAQTLRDLQRLKKEVPESVSDKMLKQAQAEVDKIPSEYVDKLRKDMQDRMNALANQPGLSSNDSVFTNIKREWADLFGGMVGGITEPTNYLAPVGPGKTLVGTFAKGTAANYPGALVSDIDKQRAEQTMGLRDKTDVSLLDALPGAMLGGTIHTALNRGSFRTKSPEERAKAAAEQFKQGGTPPDSGDGGGGYPTIDPEFKVEKPLDESQRAAMHEIDSQQPLQQPGTPDGWDPMPTSDPRYKKALPIISKEFQVAPGEDERIANDPTIKDASYPPIENGFGKDVEGSGFNAPQLGIHEPLREQMAANQEPAHSKMEFPIEPGPFRVDPQVQSNGRPTSIKDSVISIQQLSRAKTLGQALNVVATHGTEDEKAIANAMLTKDLQHDTPFHHDLDMEFAGMARTHPRTGEQSVTMHPLHGDATTILHEATHTFTNDALYAHEAGTATPAQTKYAVEMQRLMDRAKQVLTKRKQPIDGEWFKNVREFNAYGLTEPKMQELLKAIPDNGKTLMERFINTVKNLFGVHDHSVFRKLLESTHDWEGIQAHSAKERADAVFRINLKDEYRKAGLDPQEFEPKKYETWDRITGEFIGKPGDILHTQAGEPFKLENIHADRDGNIFLVGQVYGERGHPGWQHLTIPSWATKETSGFFKGTSGKMEDLVNLATARLKAPDPIPQYQLRNDLSPADKGWNNIFQQGFGLKGPGKKQGGSIDPKAFVDAAKWLFGASDKAAEVFERKLAAQFGPLRNPDEMKMWTIGLSQEDIDSGKFKDLPGIGNKGKDGSTAKSAGVFMMQNQLAMAADKNPLASSLWNFLRRGTEESQVRMDKYDSMASEGERWWADNIKDGVDYWREWERLQVVPELRPVRDQIEAGGDQAVKDWMVKQGISPEAVDKLLPFAKIMADVEKVDGAKLNSYGRTLNHEPFYLPLARSGPYHIMLSDAAGKIQYARGYETLSEAKRELKILKENMPSDWTAGDVFRTDPSRSINSIMTQAMVQGGPQWLKDATAKMYTSRIEWERNFELSRASDRKIGGYIGEVAPKTDAEYRDLAAAYMKAFAHRIRESHHLENASNAVEIINKVLSGGEENPVKVHLPNTYAWMHAILSRHIGLDISGNQMADTIQQGTAEQIGRLITKIDSVYHGYELGKNDNVYGPRAAAAFWQGASFIASSAKILASPVTTLANLLQNAFIGLEGVRHAALNGNSPLHAMEAQVKALAYYAHPNAYPEVKAFIEQARKEGIVEPHGREDYSLLETKDRNRNLQGLTDALQAPRDVVERMTNHWSLAYTKFYVDAAYDHLTDAQKKDVVYNQVHDFTANYSQLAKMMAFDKLGSIGHSVSNFSKWNFNRIGRYVNDLKFVANIPEVGPRALLPIMTSMMIGLTTAGLYGTIGVADYEAFRKLGQATGWWDWRPASAWITKFAPDAKENWQKRGFLQGVSDDIASTFFNEPTGPDVSSSMRESSPAELSTVTFQVLGDIIHDAGIAMKGFLSSKDVDEFMQKIPGWNKVWDSMKDTNAGKGLSSDNMKQLVNSLPTVAKGLMQDTLLEPKVQNDGTVKYVVPELKRDQGMYVRDEFQRQVARATNIRTADENNAAEARSFSEWQKRQKAENLKVLKEGLEEAVMDPKMADTRRVSDNALQILQNHGEDALNAVERDLETKMAQKLQTDYMGNELMQAAKMRDAITMQKALERIEFARKIWNQKEAK